MLVGTFDSLMIKNLLRKVGSALVLTFLIAGLNSPKPTWALGALKCLVEGDIDAFGFRCLEGIFDNLLTKIIVLVGIGSFLVLTFGGFKYITAGGDQKAIDGARKTITYALLGFVLTVIIYFIFAVLLGQLGLLNFLQFTIPDRNAPGW